MIIGIAKLIIFISASSNLKEKRMVLRSLKSKLRSNFNISIIELDDQDKWQKSTLAFATIGKEKTTVNSSISNIINYVEQNKDIQLLDYEMELI
ncbi:MAG: DUF503 domain-containing protein [Candidatus Omnitrophica bacterium]|nr:DUF503 domain-containing protein [Candidatus Omnitrophota bacterium]MDD5352806.1 DUF503 domain-containing protein [Candidatus Omnitrophota bacterium]MDD5550405.1 DUF503 domain-containing protein [Candidatus Omnitrophota bacterium]